jgi:GAF domain-containing protein
MRSTHAWCAPCTSAVALTVPLVARDRVLGVITWVAAESERHYTREDVALAEELAKRAAVSIDNSELHSQTLAAAVQLQTQCSPSAWRSPRAGSSGTSTSQ